MFGISFLNPFLLAGGALASVPLIIHLLHRRRYRIVDWAAMEFLLASSQRSRRRMQIQELLLLILRTLIILVLVLALSRPYWRATGIGVSGAGNRYVVLLIDNSFSMDYFGGNQSAFEKALNVAAGIVDDLKSGDTVSVVTLREPPQAIIREPSLNREVVQKEIAGLQLSDAGTDVLGALRIAAELIDKAELTRNEVILITDMQRSGWGTDSSSEDAALAEATARLSKKAQMTLVDVGLETMENRAITSLVSTDKIVGTDLLSEFAAEITNSGPDDVRQLIVNFYADGYKQRDRAIDVDAGETQRLTFTHTFRTAGPHQVMAEIDADNLKLDNRRYVSVGVRDSLSVLLVDGEPAQDGPGETWFLNRALNPDSRGGADRVTVIAPVERTDIGLGVVDLKEHDLVVLANVALLPADVLPRLEDYVQNGGALVVFLGDRVDQAFYNDELYRGGQGLLPARLDGITAATEGEYETLIIEDYDHPITQMFRGMKAAGPASGQVYKHHTAALAEDTGAKVLCTYSGGGPALIEKNVGLGRVLLITTSCDDEWNNLPRSVIYLPLMHQIVDYAARVEGPYRNQLVGDPLRLTILPQEYAGELTMLPPGEAGEVAVSAVPRGDEFLIDYADTWQAGLYELRTRDEAGGDFALRDYFAVNPPPAESDLSRISESEIRRRLPELAFQLVEEFRTDTVRAEKAAAGRQLWRSLLYGLLILLCLESVLAQKLGRQ